MKGIETTILTIIWLPWLSTSSPSNHVQRKKFDFPVQEFAYSYESYIDGDNIFAECKNSNESEERRCHVVRIQAHDSRDTQECNVGLTLNQRKGEGNVTTDRIAVAPLGKDHVIFYLAEEGKNANVKFNVINFNDCKFATTEVSVVNPDNNPKQAVIVVPYDDCFDVFYRDPSKCGDKGFCKITINTEGKVTSGPDVAIDSDVYKSFSPYIVPISTHSQDKGFFYMKLIDGTDDEYDFILQKTNGQQKSLGKHKVHSPVVKSTVHDFVGVCYSTDAVNSNFNCTQYDTNGNVKFEMSGHSVATMIFHGYNLPKGGFLLFAGKCPTSLGCELDKVSFVVIKIDSTGKNVGTYNIGKLNFEFGIKGVKIVPSFYINKDNKYCALIAQYERTDSGHRNVGYITSTTTCFTDEDFSI